MDYTFQYSAFGRGVSWAGEAACNGHPSPEQKNFARVQELIERVAVRAGRLDHLNCIEIETGRSRLSTLCWDVLAAVRLHRDKDNALVIRQKAGVGGRRIWVRLTKQSRSPANQLRRLQKSLRQSIDQPTSYQIEAAYFELTEGAWDYLRQGWRSARESGMLASFTGEASRPATLLFKATLSRELLAVIVPLALEAATRRGRRPVHARDDLASRLLDAAAEARGSDAAILQPTDYEPIGPGVKFIQEIETIFDVALLPRGSSRAAKRIARQRKSSRSA